MLVRTFPFRRSVLLLRYVYSSRRFLKEMNAKSSKNSTFVRFSAYCYTFSSMWVFGCNVGRMRSGPKAVFMVTKKLPTEDHFGDFADPQIRPAIFSGQEGPYVLL